MRVISMDQISANLSRRLPRLAVGAVDQRQK